MTDNGQTLHHGNCHCGRFRYQVYAPAITSAIACSCSLCQKKGYLWLDVGEKAAFSIVRDDGQTTEYESATIRDKFCGHCGTGIVGEHLTGPLQGRFLVNIRAIRDPYVNPFNLEHKIEYTKAEGDTRTLQHLPEPTDDRPAHHVAACHCGLVRAEMLTPIQDEKVKEDNCSTCVRNAYIGVYPTRSNVRIHGREHTFEYLHGSKFSGSAHCITCGVLVFSNIYGPPLSIFDKLPPGRKEAALAVYHKNMAIQPLNVRAMKGLDIGSLQIDKTDEGTEGYVLDAQD